MFIFVLTAPKELLDELVFNVGGEFMRENGFVQYRNGRKERYRHGDLDYLCRYDLFNLAQNWVVLSTIKQLHFCEHGMTLDKGSVALVDDNNFKRTVAVLEEHKTVEIYVECFKGDEVGTSVRRELLPDSVVKNKAFMTLSSSEDKKADDEADKRMKMRQMMMKM